MKEDELYELRIWNNFNDKYLIGGRGRILTAPKWNGTENLTLPHEPINLILILPGLR